MSEMFDDEEMMGDYLAAQTGDIVTRPCTHCPDGYVWTQDGPTSKTCPVCKGKAYLVENAP